jgi:hypothetical protein
MKREAANAAPPSTTSSAVARGIAPFEVGVEVCVLVTELAPESVVLMEVISLVEAFVGVASAFLDADET